MDGILELQRRTHEVVDHLEEAIVQAMVQQPKTHKGRLLQEHYVSSLLDQIVVNTERLQALYTDSTGRQESFDAITLTDPKEDASFYEQLKSVKDRRRRLDSTIDDVAEAESLKASARLSDAALGRMFSGEESLGKYLDLLEPYDMYINLRDVRKVEYLRYLDQVDRFEEIPTASKSSPAYAAYLESLRAYLESFMKKTKPLFDYSKAVEEETGKFERLWAEAALPGWQTFAGNESEELFCQACQKQFYNPSVFTAHLTGKKHQKAAAEFKTSAETEKKDIAPPVKKDGWAMEIALKESLIKLLLGIFEKEREETKGHVEAKQSRSSAERALDLEREEEAETRKSSKPEKAEEEDDDKLDPKIYNPLNLPLDWDGKPIPYWLWKLHGLGTRYPCEICGNQVYMGRKAFDQHFYEWRHSHGLRCLGIPNTRHFFQVTSIQDALGLWDKLKKEARQANFRPEAMEEVEDQHGNVYSRKTYEDLKRQGLL